MTEPTSKKNVRLRTIILVVAIVVLAWLRKSWAVGPVDEVIDANSDEAVILNGWPKVQICINNGGTRNSTKWMCELAVDNNADAPTDADDENNDWQPTDDENAALSGDTTLTGDGSLSGEVKAGFGIKTQ